MKPVGVVALAWLLAGCGGRGGGAGSRTQDGGVPGVGLSDARSIDDQDSPSGLTPGPTVWVGQIADPVTYPNDYNSAAVLTLGMVTGSEKVVLILDAKSNRLIGTITFGDVGPPPPATDWNQPYPPPLEAADGRALPENFPALLQAPFPGFSYALVSSTFSEDLLQLAFVPAQIFQSWCAIQDASMPDAMYPCICDGGACTPVSSPVRQLTLTVSGDSMQGQLLGLGAGPSDIRLQRVQ